MHGWETFAQQWATNTGLYSGFPVLPQNPTLPQPFTIEEWRGLILLSRDAECLAWSLPKGEEDPRNKSRWVRINTLGLCSPGATLFEPSGYDLPAGKRPLSTIALL